ncbi:sialate O-acetylesterase [Acuticoccus sp. M5D2P5]|uniref:sialate O-acetylesterase n=1 Tax=Acuticoccus kalidii TaxID=2910977 RepID=UPI001F36E25B|nr:sialate O-acetylesterase [Acuticoccus kalidii]MCF3936660.1 sialate O-acetylesterase [Acuticoccus kalidii]
MAAFGIGNWWSPQGPQTGGQADPYAQLHTAGLLAEYRLDEGSGTTVTDRAGGHDIDLTDTAKNPNLTWTGRGVRTEAGKLETPTITGARTIVFLYRDNALQNAGHVVSGGSSSSDGWYGTTVRDFEEHWIGQGRGVTKLVVRSGGSSVYPLQTGGWRVGFRELGGPTNSAFAFGGRQNSTSSRCPDYEVAWIGIYDDVLNDAERAAIYGSMRQVAQSRGFYIDVRDCPASADALIMWGQSNIDGRALVGDIASGETSFSTVKIGADGFGGMFDEGPAMADLDIGTNQQATNPALYFGPELGIARAHVAAAAGRDLYLSKCAEGGTYMAPTSADVPVGKSWSIEETFSAAGVWRDALPHLLRHIAQGLDLGIGLEVKALLWMQGDADTEGPATADLWANEFEKLVDTLRVAIGSPTLKIVVARISDRLSPTDPAAFATVRAAQVVGGAGGVIDVVVDTDPFSMASVDHLDADGQLALGNAFYAAAYA